MHPMVIDRRSFLAGGAATMLQPSSRASAEERLGSLFAANVVEPDGTSSAVAYSTAQSVIRKVRLPGRGHDLSYNRATGLLVSFARRPGNFAVAFDYRNRLPPRVFTTPANRHFYGHGVFSHDGRLLYTTENDFQNGEGKIGVYDVAGGFQRIGEHASHGIGPHDLALLSDGRTLVVANGGLETHPQSGRKPLNIATMSSSLAYIDRENGELLERHGLTGQQQKLSIRHLDVAGNGTIIFGCQFKGPKWQAVELIGFHRRGQAVEFLPGAVPATRALRQYVSSIAVDRSGEVAGVTSSRGQQVVYVDVQSKRVVGQARFPDISGIAAHAGGGFVVTGGNGDWLSGSGPTTKSNRENWAWDNHAIDITT